MALIGISLYAAAESYEIVVLDGVVYKLYPETGTATAYDGFGSDSKTNTKSVNIVQKVYGREIMPFDFSDTTHNQFKKDFIVDTIDMRINAIQSKFPIIKLTIPPSVKVIKQLGNYWTIIDTINISSLDHWFNIKNTNKDKYFNRTKLCIDGKVVDNLVTPKGLTTLRKASLPGIGIKSLTVSEGVEKIEDFFIFRGEVDSISLPESLNEISESSFYTLGIKSIRIKSNSLKLPRYLGLDSYPSIKFPNIYVDDIAKWCSVGGYEFIEGYVSNLLAVDTEDGILYVPEGVANIRSYGLHIDHEKVKGIVLPTTVNEIQSRAFDVPKDCISIVKAQSITPPALSEDNGRDRSHTYPSMIAYVPVGSGEAYRKAEGWKYFKEIIEGEPDWGNEAKADVSEEDIDYIITANNFTYGSQVKLFEIFDAAGSLIVSRKPTCEGKYSLADLPNGVYMLRINGTISGKIIR